MRNIQRISKLLGVTFKDIEYQMLDLFVEIERNRREKEEEEGVRELKILQSSINNDCKNKYNKKE